MIPLIEKEIVKYLENLQITAREKFPESTTLAPASTGQTESEKITK